MNKIQKILRVGEVVFAPDGRALPVERIGITGIYAGGGYYFSYEDHRKKFYLTKAGMMNK